MKRPGSPNLSDASGTDTSRKKQKNKHSAKQASSTPQPGSRPMSPNPSLAPSSQQSRRVSPGVSLAVDASKRNQAASTGGKKRVRNGPGGAGSGSDVDGGAASGSDGGTVQKKLKLNPPGVRSPNNGTPRGSRGGSPVNPGGRLVTGSRASSPDGAGVRGKHNPWHSLKPLYKQTQNYPFPTRQSYSAPFSCLRSMLTVLIFNSHFDSYIYPRSSRLTIQYPIPHRSRNPRRDPRNRYPQW